MDDNYIFIHHKFHIICDKLNINETNINKGTLNEIVSEIKKYNDKVREIDLNDLLIKHNKSKTLMTLVVAPIENPFGLLDVDKNNRVIKFREKPILIHLLFLK